MGVIEAASIIDDRYRSLFGTIDEGLCVMELVYDERGRLSDLLFREVNDAFERQTGLHDVVGRTLSELLPNVEQHWIDVHTRVMQTGVSERSEHYVKDLDRWYRVRQSRVGGSDSRLIAVVFDDISDRKRAEMALRAGLGRQSFLLKLSDALRAQPDADAVAKECTRILADHMALDRCYVARLSHDENCAWVGPEYHRPDLPPLTGKHRFSDFPDSMKRLETEPLVICDLANEPGLSALDKTSLGALQMASLICVQLRRGTQQRIWALIVGCVAPREWTREELDLVTDVAERSWAAIERARGEVEVRGALEHVEQLVAERTTERDILRWRLSEVEERERRRLARELHDQVGQDLTAIRLGLDDAARIAALHVPAGAPLMKRLSQLGTLTERLTSGIRYVALELRSPELDDGGLGIALETYVLEWSMRYGIAADLEVGTLQLEPPIPDNVASALYRIAQEALTNVAKHARATQVSVILEHRDGEARLIVEDDGEGFDMGADIERAKAERRLGLAGMQERAILIGGRIAIESRAGGGGTTLYARLPTTVRGGEARVS